MTATFKPGNDLLPQYRDLAHDYADQALRALQQEDPLSPETVHSVRVSIKHLRALGQLLRPFELGETSKRMDRLLRDAAGALSSARDTRVLQATLDELPESTRRPYEQQALHQVRQQEFPDASGNTHLSMPQAVWDALCVTREHWQALPLEVDNVALIDQGLSRTYKKARKLSFEALAAETPEQWHELRKWAKYLLFQLQPLEPILVNTDHRPANLDALGRTLGKLHDLHVLIERLDERERRRRHSEELATALLVIRRRETALLEEVRKATRSCFANKPRVFCQQLLEARQYPRHSN